MWPIEDLDTASKSIPVVEGTPGAFDSLEEIFDAIAKLPERQRLVILKDRRI